MDEILRFVAAVIGLLFVCYLAARVISIAWFRSKQDFSIGPNYNTYRGGTRHGYPIVIDDQSKKERSTKYGSKDQEV